MKKTFRKSVSLLLSLTMMIGIFAGITPAVCAVDYCGYEPEMTMEDLYEDGLDAIAGKCYSIHDADELLQFAEYVNSGKPTAGVTFYLKADIKLPDKEWNPIGTDEHMFVGTLDGWTVESNYDAGVTLSLEADGLYATFGKPGAMLMLK